MHGLDTIKRMNAEAAGTAAQDDRRPVHVDQFDIETGKRGHSYVILPYLGDKVPPGYEKDLFEMSRVRTSLDWQEFYCCIEPGFYAITSRCGLIGNTICRFKKTG